MATRQSSSNSSSLQRPIPAQAIYAVAVLAVLVLGWLTYRTFGPEAQPETFTVKEQRDWVSELARKSAGDFSKLSAAEQKRLNGISFGNGARMLASAYKKQAGGQQ